MSNYLERLAATAITPGGTFHPLAGTVYAPADDASVPPNPFPQAEPFAPNAVNAQRTPPLSLVRELTPSVDPEAPTSAGKEPFPPRPSLGVMPLLPEPSSSTLSAIHSTNPHQPASHQQTPEAKEIPLVESLPESSHQARPPENRSTKPTSPQASTPNPRPLPGPSPGIRSAVLAEASESAHLLPSSQPKSIPGTRSALTHPRVQASAIPLPPTPPSPSTPDDPQPASPLAEAPPGPLAAPSFTPRSVPARPPYQPLVAGYVPPVAPSRAPSTPQPSPRSASPRSPEPHLPDEIQIHIGRIEVTAATPAPRSQPAAPRSTPSLDAYLRRGNGRA